MANGAPQGSAPLSNNVAVGAAIGAAWGIWGGPPGIVVGAITGGVIGHFWGMQIHQKVKKLFEDK